MKINVAGLPEASSGIEPLAPDRYTVLVTQCEETENKSTDGTHIAWVLTVEEPAEFAGRKVFHNTPLSEAGKGFTKEILEAAGIPYDGEGFATEDCLGRRLIVALGVEEYQGRKNNKVRNCFPVE